MLDCSIAQHTTRATAETPARTMVHRARSETLRVSPTQSPTMARKKVRRRTRRPGSGATKTYSVRVSFRVDFGSIEVLLRRRPRGHRVGATTPDSGSTIGDLA